MYAHLNTRTRKLVYELMAGGSPTIGGQKSPALAEDQRRLLHVLVTTLNSQSKGVDLVKQVETGLASLPLPPTADGAIGSNANGTARPWRFGKIRAESFRGLAPAGHIWTYDFEGKSHLLYGPNGCGKSSLMGAVAWVLTGKVFRDDCKPSEPEDVGVFTTADKAKVAGTRPCALALTDVSGKSTAVNAAFWVELELLSDQTPPASPPLWIRRHRTDGLAKSADGRQWQSIKTIEDIGVSELDTELNVLMPARVSHLNFGKQPELVHLFSQVVGLDDLEAIAEAAKTAHTAFMRAANSIEKDALAPQRARIAEMLNQFGDRASSEIKHATGFATLAANTISRADITRVGTQIGNKLADARSALTVALGLNEAMDRAQSDGSDSEQLKRLPGEVATCLEKLTEPLFALFPSTLQAGQPSVEDISDLHVRLKAFARSARTIANDRSTWMRREQSEPDLPLMLLAATKFNEDANECPICHRDMTDVPVRRAELLELQSASKREHLHRRVSDLELALLSDCNSILPAATVKQAERGFQRRLSDDWTALKKAVCSGPLLQMANKLDPDIAAISEETIPLYAADTPYAHASEQLGSFPILSRALEQAERYLVWARAMNLCVERTQSKLESAIRAGTDSLRSRLEAGRATCEQIEVLTYLHQLATSLYKAVVDLESNTTKMKAAQAVAASAVPIKDIGDLVRKEASDVVKQVEPEVKRYYSLLYRDEVLELDLITPGHAANRTVKTEINAYFKVGQERVPIAPFSNAGRLRGIMLSFVFALLKHSRGTIGLIVFDDPALSMDDEHKSRFVTHLIGPAMTDRQVLIATHYEHFFKAAETHFRHGVRLNIVPKRSRADAVSFEPADLLTRLEQTIARPTALWREAANNLRLWAERTLSALSAYAPEPFTIFNNIPGSVAAYKAITHGQIATRRRDQIVSALSDPVFELVRNRCAHDEEPSESEVRDALRLLQTCAEHVDYELQRFKGLHRHSILGRGVGRRPSLEPLAMVAKIGARRIEIKGRAAAAQGGTGVVWSESTFIDIPQLAGVLVLDQTLAPVCGRGDIAILDCDDAAIENADLVAVSTEDGHRYLRRFWSSEHGVQLEAMNPTIPYEPIYLGAGRHSVRRVRGVVFASMRMKSRVEAGKEWTVADSLPSSQLKGIIGVRVHGASLDPLARDGQVVLVQGDSLRQLEAGTLACVDIEESGAVIKRCFPVGDRWLLSPVNPVELIQPMVVDVARILHAYPVVGVLFSTSSESEH